jgi:pentatricopeptide repeat protein
MERAEEVVREMKNTKGIEVGYITYALLVNGYSKSNQAEKAINKMEEMESAGMALGSEVMDSIVNVLVRKV